MGVFLPRVGVKLPGMAWARHGAGLGVSKGDPAVLGWMGQWCSINASGHATTFWTHLLFFFCSFFSSFCKYHPSTRAWGGGGIHGRAQQQPGSDPVLFPPHTAARKTPPSAEGF